MLASLFSKPQSSLSAQAKRLVAMRFLIYTGFQTSYFIGVIGTLTYADDASVVATSLAVLFMNVFVILGSFAGGAFHHGGAALRAEDGDPIGCRLLGGVRVRPHPLSLEITDCDFKIRFLS